MLQGKPASQLIFCIVKNDNKHNSAVKLIHFKQIIGKALPNMDKPHIIHLLFDHRHESLLAYKDNQLIGGTCFAIFQSQVFFAELAFLAVKAEKRTQGYGRMIMNKQKAVLQSRKVNYMITYGDNMALGFFRKQGFSEKITMPRQTYQGTIKQYDGGKLMECKINSNVDYLNIDAIIKKQKQFLINKLKILSTNQAKFTLTNIQNQSNNQNKQFVRKLADGKLQIFKRDPRTIPGIIQSNWSWQQHDQLKKYDIEPFSIRCVKLLQQIKRYPQAKYFLQPVSSTQVPNYYEIVRNPMDFQTISSKLRNSQYKNQQHICQDIQLIFSNCRNFNHPDSVYYKSGVQLQKITHPLIHAFKNAIINTSCSPVISSGKSEKQTNYGVNKQLKKKSSKTSK